jgi:hypothetical protein
MQRRQLVWMAIHVLVAALLCGIVHAQTSYGDNFESPTLNSFWAVTQQYGSVTLSRDQNHTPGGRQALKFASTGGGQRNISVSHQFALPQKGAFSIWLYDTAPGQETQYEFLTLYNSVTTDQATIGTMDFDANCYAAFLYNANSGIRQGPNQNCGVYPQVSTTNVHRTAGWHNFKISVGVTSISLSIDGNAVFTTNGPYGYDSITLSQSGPYWRPDTESYWDDFTAAVWNGNR